jgi:hypothetical protein
MSESVAAPTEFALPPSVITKTDVSRLVAEIEKIDNQLTTAEVHAKVGVGTQEEPMVSQRLADFLTQNQLTLSGDAGGNDRSALIKTLHQMKDNLPVIHMTFAVEADQESLAQLVQWLRASIHPHAVIAVGLQPALIAGVYLRTPNHVHDLSLRAQLQGGHDLLIKELEAFRG